LRDFAAAEVALLFLAEFGEHNLHVVEVLQVLDELLLPFSGLILGLDKVHVSVKTLWLLRQRLLQLLEAVVHVVLEFLRKLIQVVPHILLLFLNTRLQFVADLAAVSHDETLFDFRLDLKINQTIPLLELFEPRVDRCKVRLLHLHIRVKVELIVESVNFLASNGKFGLILNFSEILFHSLADDFLHIGVLLGLSDDGPETGAGVGDQAVDELVEIVVVDYSLDVLGYLEHLIEQLLDELVDLLSGGGEGETILC
jgi:hypothetical protein